MEYKQVSGLRKAGIGVVAGLAAIVSSAALGGCADYQILAGGEISPISRYGNNGYYSLDSGWNIINDTKDAYVISNGEKTKLIKKEELVIEGKPAELIREESISEGIFEKLFK